MVPTHVARAALKNFVGNIPALLNFIGKIATHDIRCRNSNQSRSKAKKVVRPNVCCTGIFQSVVLLKLRMHLKTRPFAIEKSTHTSVE